MVSSFGRTLLPILAEFLFPVRSVLSSQVCPNGWTRFQNKCFFFYPDKSYLNFYEGHLVCKDFFNGTLASIHSDEEQAFVSKLCFSTNRAQNHVWIGARRATSDRFVWEDNTAFDYTNWAKSQPNNLDGKHFCTSLLQSNNLQELGLWYDDPCADRYHVLCQLYLDTNRTTVSTTLPIKPAIKTTNNKPITTFRELKSVYNKTLGSNSSTIAALIASKQVDPEYSYTNVSLIIISVFEFVLIILLVYVVFRKSPLPYRTLVMSECDRNSVQNVNRF